jgi:hypothetical protein
MKRELAPLVLLIPAVVLAQPAPQAPAPQPPQAGMMPNSKGNLTNTASAANALDNARNQTKEDKQKSTDGSHSVPFTVSSWL